MKAKFLASALVLLFAVPSVLFSQGFKSPAEGKAVAYFVRVTDYGAPSSFDFFHQDKYIGAFKGVNYLRYECEPGENLFWASSENKEFITADLKAGGTYVVIVNVSYGIAKLHLGLQPIKMDDKEIFDKAKTVVNSREAVVTDIAKIEAMNKKLGAKFIPAQLKKYNNDLKETGNLKHISADMAIPEADLK